MSISSELDRIRDMATATGTGRSGVVLGLHLECGVVCMKWGVIVVVLVVAAVSWAREEEPPNSSRNIETKCRELHLLSK